MISSLYEFIKTRSINVMVKKIILASAILASTISVAMASSAPYVGASVGVNANTSTHAADGNAGTYRGLPVKLFAGYGSDINETLYLGGEVTATLGSAEISNKNHMKTNYGIGLSVMPGVMLNDNTMAYGRGGFVRTRFSNVNKMSTGGLLGLGLQTAMTQHVDLRGEYAYTTYANTGGIQSPRMDEFDVGVAYKFD
jgi:opacity protein-like surface antigen